MHPFPAQGVRLLARVASATLLAQARHAVKAKDTGLAMLCAEEASHRWVRTHKAVLAAIEPLGIPPKRWIAKARDIALTVRRATDGEHYVYVILLYNPSRKPSFGLYVGETFRKPRERFAQHRRGYKAGKAAKKYGVCLLPALYEHLNPFDKKMNLRVQNALLRRFDKGGFWVEGK